MNVRSGRGIKEPRSRLGSWYGPRGCAGPTATVFFVGVSSLPVRPRLPSLRPFSVGTGLFVGVAVGIVAHHLAPGVSVPGSDVGLAPAVGFLVLLAVWVALEQVPAVVDRLLLARGHYALVVVALAPVVVVLVGDASGVVTFTEATRLQTVGFTLIGLFATAATTGQRARLLRERESVAIAVEAVESRWRRLALTFLAFVLSYGAFGLVYPAAVSVWSFLGVVFGLGLGMLVVGEHRVELVAHTRGMPTST